MTGAAKPWPGSGARYDEVETTTTVVQPTQPISQTITVGSIVKLEDQPAYKPMPWVQPSKTSYVGDPLLSSPLADQGWAYVAEHKETFQSVFKSIFDEAFDLLVERQKKYGPTNISSQGIFGVFTRLRNDKIERLKRAMNGRIENGEIVLDTDLADFGDESFDDALLDVANYALIILALKRGLWGKPLAEDGK